MQIYLVGGAVRDRLLRHPVYDRDWVVVGATPQQMLAQGFQPVGKDFPVFIHPKTGEEYALARTERKSGKGYTGFTYSAAPDVTLEEDLLRRDLTINAMAEADDGTLIDPYHGARDLEARILRHVSPAFAEDPLRVLRVARFAARYAHLGFSVAPETLALMRALAHSDELEHLTAERVWKETERALGEPTPATYIELLSACDALPKLFPEWHPLTASEGAITQLRATLNNVQRQGGSATECFSTLMAQATAAENEAAALSSIQGLCARLRTPKAWLEQALQVRQWHAALARFDTLSADQRFEVIQSLDLLRRPQRLPGVLCCCAALHPEAAIEPSRFLRLLEKLNSLQPQNLMAQGFKGKALGDELSRRRIVLCEEWEDTP